MKGERNLTRTIAVTGMILGITIIMASTPLGTIPLFNVEITIAHLPTIVLAMLEGPVCGLIAGLAMGIVSMVICLVHPVTVLSPFIANPLISVLPRMFIGLAACYAYRGSKALCKGLKAGEPISAVIGAAAGSLTNTLGVLGMLYVVYAADLLKLLMDNGMGGTTVAVFLLGIALGNGAVEMVVVTILSALIVTALKKAGYGRT